MITKKLAKQLIEKAEYNMSKQNVDYSIDSIDYNEKESASLVIASSANVQTSFVSYDDGTAFHGLPFLFSVCFCQLRNAPADRGGIGGPGPHTDRTKTAPR